MQVQDIPNDIKVFYVTATSFPDGVRAAFKALEDKITTQKERMRYGISFPVQGTIVYKAAAEELQPGEGELAGCETYTIKKGRYITVTLHNWLQDETSIGKTFQQLLADPRIDHNGACVEQYINKDDVVCMVRLADDKI